mmetsp:Transcript_20312/g.50703  ORF Transcript_20312/g.50703 Transcript_20312/m.50703 type:complete len:212 (-) Transcript_20312:1027-1662(-)
MLRTPVHSPTAGRDDSWHAAASHRRGACGTSMMMLRTPVGVICSHRQQRRSAEHSEHPRRHCQPDDPKASVCCVASHIRRHGRVAQSIESVFHSRGTATPIHDCATARDSASMWRICADLLYSRESAAAAGAQSPTPTTDVMTCSLAATRTAAAVATDPKTSAAGNESMGVPAGYATRTARRSAPLSPVERSFDVLRPRDAQHEDDVWGRG